MNENGFSLFYCVLVSVVELSQSASYKTFAYRGVFLYARCSRESFCIYFQTPILIIRHVSTITIEVEVGIEQISQSVCSVLEAKLYFTNFMGKKRIMVVRTLRYVK